MTNACGDENITSSFTLRLFGLPFKATEEDCRAFVVENSKSTTSNVTTITIQTVQIGAKKPKKNQPKRGEAWVKVSVNAEEGRMKTTTDKQSLVEALHKKHMQDRFIEVSLLEEDGDGVPLQDQKAEEQEVDQTGSLAEPQPKKRKLDKSSSINHTNAGYTTTNASPAASCSTDDASPNMTTGEDKNSTAGKIALRLFGIPFTAEAKDVLEFLQENYYDKVGNIKDGDEDTQAHLLKTSMPKEQDVWVGTIRKWELAETDCQPCKGEAWVYNFLPNEKAGAAADVIKIIQKNISDLVENKSIGSRFINCSFINTETNEVTWHATDPKMAKEQLAGKQGGKNAMKGKGKDGKGAVLSDKGERELFVRFLPYEATEEDVSEFFQHGLVAKQADSTSSADADTTSTENIIERVKLYKKAGMGFVTYSKKEYASQAVELFDNAKWNTRSLRVCLSKDREDLMKEKTAKGKGKQGTSSSWGTSSNADATSSTHGAYDNGSSAGTEVEDKTKLFLSGLPFDCTEKDVRTLLAAIEPKIMEENQNLHCKIELLVEKERSKFLGKAIAQFQEEDRSIAEKIQKYANNLANEPVMLKNRLIRIAFCREKAKPDYSNADPLLPNGSKKKVYYQQLFLKFLPLEAKESDVQNWLKENEMRFEPPAGTVEAGICHPEPQDTNSVRRIKLCKDSDGYSKGIGFLFFETEDAAWAGIEALNGAEFWEKHVEVTWATRNTR
ncbi:unnamed protein product [Amoebophrya sp. A120]|nr:unnamed protein product [Amoebophrya sp. A120]|eukprot:GSA120T00020672001.1